MVREGDSCGQNDLTGFYGCKKTIPGADFNHPSNVRKGGVELWMRPLLHAFILTCSDLS